MSGSEITTDARFAAIVETMHRHTAVSGPAAVTEAKQRFGANALKVNGKIFAMLVKDELVVKLPRAQVDTLIAAGVGKRFDPGHGRVMKEWISVAPDAGEEWLVLAQEAMAFVASKG